MSVIGVFNRRGVICVKDNGNEWRKALSIRKYSTGLFLVMYLHKQSAALCRVQSKLAHFFCPMVLISLCYNVIIILNVDTLSRN